MQSTQKMLPELELLEPVAHPAYPVRRPGATRVRITVEEVREDSAESLDALERDADGNAFHG